MSKDKQDQTIAEDKSAATEQATESGDAAGSDQKVNGRSVFAVETTAAGIVVRTAFLADDQRLLAMPAMFPSLDYALQQIDELRQLVTQHFNMAAQVGAKVIAAQAQANNAAASASVAGADKPTVQ